MIPDALAGSYQRYKSDTNVFTTWLAKTAETCGYTAPKTTVQASGSGSASASASTSTSASASATPPDPSKSLAEQLREKAAKKAAKKEQKKQADSQPTTPTVKYSVGTQDLVRQAEIVSRNIARIKIPDTVLQVVGRAIRARKRCTAWFQKTGLEDESTETHQHFIGILENVVQILSPATTTSIEGLSKPNKTKDGDVASLSNRFTKKLACARTPKSRR